MSFLPNLSSSLPLFIIAFLPTLVSANGGMALYLGTILGSIFGGAVIIGILVFFMYFFCKKTVIKDYKDHHNHPSGGTTTISLGKSSVKLPPTAKVEYVVPAPQPQQPHHQEPRDSWLTNNTQQQQLGMQDGQAQRMHNGSVSIASTAPLPDGDRQRYGSESQQPPMPVLYQPQQPATGFGSAV